MHESDTQLPIGEAIYTVNICLMLAHVLLLALNQYSLRLAEKAPPKPKRGAQSCRAVRVESARYIPIIENDLSACLLAYMHHTCIVTAYIHLLFF